MTGAIKARHAISLLQQKAGLSRDTAEPSRNTAKLSRNTAKALYNTKTNITAGTFPFHDLLPGKRREDRDFPLQCNAETLDRDIRDGEN